MTRQTVAAGLADMLSGYGTTHIFYLPAVLRRMLVEIERRTSIQRVHAHSEAGAAYMADGYARASGRPGICMAQIVGALNLCAGLRDAHLAHSPVIAFSGGRDASMRDRWAYQEVDDLPAFERYTKMNAAIDDPGRVADMVRQAFRVATTGCPGPVHLQFRGNVGQLEDDETDFDGIVEPRYSRVPADRPAPDPERVRAAVERIARASRPIIVAGGGVRASGAENELLHLAEGMRIPVATSLNAKDAIIASNPLSVGVVGTYSRRSANEAVANADLVVFVGTRAGGMTTHFWSIPAPGTDTIHIDLDPSVIGRNYANALGVTGDAKATLASMAEHNAPVPPQRGAWLEAVDRYKSTYSDEQESMLTCEQSPIRPERICGELSRSMPEDAMVVVDTGHAGMWMGGLFDISARTQSYIRSAGHLGWAFPAALGAKCALPQQPVVCFTGDLGFWYHMAEVETAVRCGINTITVVNNNHSGNQALPSTRKLYDGNMTPRSGELWTNNETNFATLAQNMGAIGMRIEKPADIGPAFKKALTADRPVVIDIVSDIEALAPTAWEL